MGLWRLNCCDEGGGCPLVVGDALRARLQAAVPCVAALRSGKVAVVDAFLSPDAVAAARKCVDGLDLRKSLQSAVGARDDAIAFVDEAHCGPALASAVYALRAVAARLNEAAGERWVAAPRRAMVAVYAGGGARYARHRDRAPDNGREVTAILYLNPADPPWRPDADGGCLEVDETSRVRGAPRPDARRRVVVPPVGGTLVLFPSDLEHEVRPAFRRRAALTAWFVTAAPAAAPKPPVVVAGA